MRIFDTRQKEGSDRYDENRYHNHNRDRYNRDEREYDQEKQVHLNEKNDNWMYRNKRWRVIIEKGKSLQERIGEQIKDRRSEIIATRVTEKNMMIKAEKYIAIRVVKRINSTSEGIRERKLSK